MRPLLTRLHFYAGLFIAPFILIAATSGFLYAATPALEKVVYDDVLTTDSRGPALSLDEQIERAREVKPDLPLAAVRPATEVGQTTRIQFDAGRTDESYQDAVFVDPVTGDITGQLEVYGGSGALPLRAWVDQLHRSLHLGDWGRVYTELAASWLWIIALAGLALWWTGPHRNRARKRSRLRPTRDGGPRKRTLSWHGAVGTWLVLGMLMLSATGLTWSQFAGANVTELRAALDWSTPTVASDLESSIPADKSGADQELHEGHEGHEGHSGAAEPEKASGPDSPGIGYQWAWEIARDEGLTANVEITPPSSDTGTYVVTENEDAFPTQADAASVDPQSGDVVDVVRFDDYPLMAKLATWGIALHMGFLFGIANQIGLMILAASMVAMIVWGYRMWWLRRPTRRRADGRRGLARFPQRGALLTAPPMGAVVFALAALALGWFIPLLGISLLAFLIFDLAAAIAAPGTAPQKDQEDLVSQTRS